MSYNRNTKFKAVDRVSAKNKYVIHVHTLCLWLLVVKRGTSYDIGDNRQMSY